MAKWLYAFSVKNKTYLKYLAIVKTRDKSQPPKILGCTKMLRSLSSHFYEPKIFGEGPSNDDFAECDFIDVRGHVESARHYGLISKFTECEDKFTYHK